MYYTYAVVIDGSNRKNRHFLEASETIEEARHMANRATCGNAAYAYVKDKDGQTVFFLGKPPPEINKPIKGADYYALKGPARLRSLTLRAPDRHGRKYHQRENGSVQIMPFGHLEPANS